MRSRNQRVIGGVALLAAGALGLTACSGSSTSHSKGAPSAANAYSYGKIPAASTTVKSGGVLHVAEDVGADPNWIFPITPAANASVYTINQFQYLSWRTLYWSPKGSAPEMDYSRSMTDAAPTVSSDGKTFSIKLNGKYSWSDGNKVSAQDVLLWFDLYKAAVKESPANASNYTPGQFPDNATAKVVNDQTISFTFNKVYNPAWILDTQLNQIVPLPSKEWAKAATGGSNLDYTQPANAKKIYDYLAKQSKSLSTYASSPLWQTVDGAYKIKSYNTSTGAATFAPNTKYSGEGKPNFSEVDLLSYTSPTAEFNDLQSGKLDLGYVSSDNWPQLNKIKSEDYNLYGLPDFGFSFMYFNFKDATGGFGKAISQLYVRQAFAHLQDENAEIKGAYKGMAAPAYGPLGVAPKSPYTPANGLKNPFPFSVSAAKKLLTDHGWKVVPNGVTTCQNPGTGANQCGAGVAKGQNLNFKMYYTSTPKVVGEEVTSFAGNLKQIGVKINLNTDTFNNIISNESNPSSPKNENAWGMADFGGFTENNYPSTNTLFNTGGTYNEGSFSDPQLDKLINASMLSTDPNALKNEISLVDADLPGIFQPNEDRIYAWSPKLSGSPDAFAALTQLMLDPEDLYFTK
ncbi:ABC transporter substrate-binding protein [Streptantibioticus silvisoli]|uniref:ABC transporter substrate-binding protein n=1 Tax=Streptantibioticus silvisoli TaxID=2705255 RepID=A0ABT6W7A6_9ACTN|nr:ABC transporter substrate-binding protein [Streptantibioticus silvisoli]MDI5966199.1 ABC transporter substrate-binding protein [Streptantibioticus silvisoli]